MTNHSTLTPDFLKQIKQWAEYQPDGIPIEIKCKKCNSTIVISKLGEPCVCPGCDFIYTPIAFWD